jgi:hypothetical protein
MAATISASPPVKSYALSPTFVSTTSFQHTNSELNLSIYRHGLFLAYTLSNSIFTTATANMPIQNNIQVQIAGSALMNGLPDLNKEISATWPLVASTSANGTVEDIYYVDENSEALMFVGRLFVAQEFEPNEATISRRINPGKSIYPGSVRYTDLATPLVKFIPSVSNKSYCIIIKVLPEYVFENPEHDFLRFTFYIDDERRVVRTISARQRGEIGGDRPWIVVVDGQEPGENFYWKDIGVRDGDDEDPEDHQDWNYNLGTIRVYVERCREEKGGEVGAEDAGRMEVVGDEEGEEKGGESGGDVRVSGIVGSKEGEDVVVEDADREEEEEEEEEKEKGEKGEKEEEEEEEKEEGEDDDDDDNGNNDSNELIMHTINLEERCLSHFTAQVPLATVPSTKKGRRHANIRLTGPSMLGPRCQRRPLHLALASMRSPSSSLTLSIVALVSALSLSLSLSFSSILGPGCWSGICRPA